MEDTVTFLVWVRSQLQLPEQTITRVQRNIPATEVERKSCSCVVDEKVVRFGSKSDAKKGETG